MYVLSAVKYSVALISEQVYVRDVPQFLTAFVYYTEVTVLSHQVIALPKL
jgi:hypothetical protein